MPEKALIENKIGNDDLKSIDINYLFCLQCPEVFYTEYIEDTFLVHKSLQYKRP